MSRMEVPVQQNRKLSHSAMLSVSWWACDRGSSAANRIIDTTLCTTNLFTETSSANFTQPLCNLSRRNAPGICPEQKRGKYTWTIPSVQVVTAWSRCAVFKDTLLAVIEIIHSDLWLGCKTLKKEPNWQVKMMWKSEGWEICSVFNWGITVKVWSEMAWKLPFTGDDVLVKKL